MNHSIADIMKDYKLKALLESDIASDPITQFHTWWSEAIDSAIEEVNAMTLATSTKDGEPSARIVLLKDYSKDGFVFFTNYESHKGSDIENNPKAALVFSGTSCGTATTCAAKSLNISFAAPETA